MVCLILSQWFFLSSTLAATADKNSGKKKILLPAQVGDELGAKLGACNAGVQRLGSSMPSRCNEAGKQAGELTMQRLASEAGAGKPSVVGAPPSERKPAAVEAPKKIEYPTETVKDINDRDIKLSVLTPEQAQALHTEMATLGRELKFKTPDAGCDARALILGQQMSQRGVESGKLWIKPGLILGSLNPRLNDSTKRWESTWDFHVAPFVLVRGADGKTEKFVIDPSVHAAGPLALEKYKARMSSRPNWISVDVTNRYPADLADRFKKLDAIQTNKLPLAWGKLETLGGDKSSGRRQGKPIDSNP